MHNFASQPKWSIWNNNLYAYMQINNLFMHQCIINNPHINKNLLYFANIIIFTTTFITK